MNKMNLKPNATKKNNTIFYRDTCWIFILIRDWLINILKNQKRYNAYWGHIVICIYICKDRKLKTCLKYSL